MRAFTENVKAGLDGELPLCWIVRLHLDGGDLTYTTIPVRIDSISYTGVGLMFGGISEIEQSIDIIGGGGIASVSHCTLTLNELAGGGIHELFVPQTSPVEEVVNRAVSIGVICQGAGLTENDISWMYSGVIESFTSTRPTFEISVISSRENEYKAIPQHVIERDNYANAPEESIGGVIPIVYGDFKTVYSATNLKYEMLDQYDIIPTVCIDKPGMIFVVSDHQMSSINRVYYSSDGKTISRVVSMVGLNSIVDPNIVTPSDGFSTIQIPEGTIVGWTLIPLVNAGYQNDVIDYAYAVDKKETTYSYIHDTAFLCLKCSGVPSGELAPSGIYAGVYLNVWFYDDGSFTTIHTGIVDDSTGTLTPLGTFTNGGVGGDTFDSLMIASTRQSSSDISKYQYVIYGDTEGDSIRVIAAALDFYYVIDAGEIVKVNVQRQYSYPDPNNRSGWTGLSFKIKPNNSMWRGITL